MKNRNNNSKNKGITLIALIITIIVLLILAGITVAQLSNNGLFENAKIAKEKYKNAQDQEDDIIGDYNSETQKYLNGSRGSKIIKKDLYLGTANEIKTYYFADNEDVTDYDFVLVTYNYAGTNSEGDYTKTMYIDTSFINKANLYDYALEGYSTAHTGFHFVDKGFSVDKIVALSNMKFIIRKMTGIKIIDE